MSDWEKTGNHKFDGLTDFNFSTPKQTEVRNTETGETRWVAGNCGDDDDDLGKHIAKGHWHDDDDD